MTKPRTSRWTRAQQPTTIENYAIQEWLFAAREKVEIDLANSAVQYQLVEDLSIEPDWGLDYAPDRGLPETRDAVAGLYGSGRIRAERVIVTNGAQEALYLFYRSLLASGEHVLVTVPGWQQSWSVPAHMGCRVTQLAWPPGARLNVDRLEALLEPATKLLVLNSPGNPSGCTISKDDWDRILAIADERGLWLLSDEEFAPDLRDSAVHRYERAISVSGLSKIYGMAGLRLGWAVAGSAAGAVVVERMVNYKRYTTISNSVLSERVGVNAIMRHADQIARYESLLAGGRRLLERFAVDNRAHLSLVPPQGTPFAWLDFRASIHSRVTARQFAQRLLDETGVRVMPAEVFGFADGLRVTYARPRAALSEGLARIGGLLDDIAADAGRRGRDHTGLPLATHPNGSWPSRR